MSNEGTYNPDITMQRAEELFKLVILILEAYEKYSEEQTRRKQLDLELVKKAKDRKWKYVATLIREGASLDEFDEAKCNALYYAAISEKFDVCKYLAKNHTQLHHTFTTQDNLFGGTVLHIAIRKNNKSLAKLFIEYASIYKEPTFFIN